MIIALGVIGAGWVSMGLPLPATLDHLDDRMKIIVSSQAEIVQRVDENKSELNGWIDFAKGTRSIVLRQDRRNIQEEIERYRDMLEDGTGNTAQTKRLIETLQADVDALERQIDELER